MSEQLIDVPLSDISDSPLNRRTHYTRIDELADSMRSHGVLEELQIRKASKGIKTPFELVFGHRRIRGARTADLATVPCKLKDLTDEQVIELQLIENGQRENQHPLDEADSFADLVERGYDVARIADKIGKPAKHVRERLQLRELSPACRKALDEEHINLGSALVLARIPQAKLQDEALREIAGDDDRSPLPSKRVGLLVRDKFMLKLAGAPFDRSDAELVKKAGPCTTCPKRTGNQAELFDDVKSPDVCTEPGCFRAKVDVYWARTVKTAKDTGVKVLPDKEVKRTFSSYGGEVGSSGNYHDLEAKIWTGSKTATVKSIIGKDTEIILGKSTNGKIYKLVTKAAVQAVLNKGKKKPKATSSSSSRKKPSESAAQKGKAEAAKLKALAHEVTLTALCTELAAAAEVKGPTPALLQAVLKEVLAGAYDGVDKFAERRGIKRDKRGYLQDQQMLKHAQSKPPAWYWGALVELLAWQTGAAHAHVSQAKTLDALCAAYKVDRKAIEKAVLAKQKADLVPAKSGGTHYHVAKGNYCGQPVKSSVGEGGTNSWESVTCKACIAKFKKSPGALATPKPTKKRKVKKS